MNNIHGTDILLSSFPSSLAVDPDKYALARVVADELHCLLKSCDDLRIYSRIDELPEDLLDILAFDFALSWYFYNGSIELKRAQIRSCFYVHRRLGTKASLERALCDLCPGSKVEEWFDYGGEPYHFRIMIDITDQRLPIVKSDIERYISIFKSLRSVLEDDSLIVGTHMSLELGISSEYIIYGTPKSSENTETRSGIHPDGTILYSKN